MPDRCPRCNRKMEAMSAWWPVKIDKEKTVHVCWSCHKEAEHIDKVFADTCARVKRKWYQDIKVKGTTIVVDDADSTQIHITF